MRLFPRPALAAACDAVAVLAFTVVGLLSHHGGVSAGGLARDALPLLAGWFAAAGLLRLYRDPSSGRLVATWACGVTVGVVARALALGHTHVGTEAEFLAVSLAFVLVFVLAARLLAALTTTGRAAS
jgi:hypothetical protein